MKKAHYCDGCGDRAIGIAAQWLDQGFEHPADTATRDELVTLVDTVAKAAVKTVREYPAMAKISPDQQDALAYTTGQMVQEIVMREFAQRRRINPIATVVVHAAVSKAMSLALLSNLVDEAAEHGLDAQEAADTASALVDDLPSVDDYEDYVADGTTDDDTPNATVPSAVLRAMGVLVDAMPPGPRRDEARARYNRLIGKVADAVGGDTVTPEPAAPKVPEPKVSVQMLGPNMGAIAIEHAEDLDPDDLAALIHKTLQDNGVNVTLDQVRENFLA